ncbi:MAG: hypothetical protein M1347_02540 [Chloroflexi bacterium]|nr:hypothetical protein [Chloroflexota bacterium]
MKVRQRTATGERTWVLVFAICLVLLTAIPYLLAASQQGAEFTGFLIGVEDGNSYIAKMLAGTQGDWLFRSPYTATEQGGALLYLPYLLLGKLLGQGAQHGALVLLFHMFRSLAVILLCFAIYDFLAHFISDVKLRRLGLGLITLGNGLGWVLLFAGVPNWLGSIPLDFYSPETFGFLAIFSLPHLVLARALLLWGLLEYLRASTQVNAGRQGKQKQRGGLLHFWWIGLLWLTIALTHLITAVLGLLIIAGHFGFVLVRKYFPGVRPSHVSRIQVEAIAWAAVGAAPVLLYNAWVYWQDSYLQTWALQNQILSPNPLHYLVAYGLLLPFAYFGLRRLLRKYWVNGSFLLVWLILLPFLLYSPVTLQRRLAEGAWVMLVILALCAFEDERRRSKAGVQGRRIAGERARSRRELWLFTMAFPSTLILLLGSLQVAQQVEPPVFRPSAEVKAFEELRQIATKGEVVLASYETGNALPAWVPLRLLAGHGPESVDLESLLPKIQAVYQGRTPDDTRFEFLQNYGVAYVFWGPSEKRFGSWMPAGENYLELIVDVGEYEIYRVLNEAFR